MPLAALAALAKTALKKLATEVVLKTLRDLAYLALGCLVVFVWLSADDAGFIQAWSMQPWGLNRLSGAGATILGVEPVSVAGGAPGDYQPVVGPVAGGNLPPPPADQWAAMVAAANGQFGCKFQPAYLAAIAFYESAYGTNPGPSSAGAWGYGQFMPFNFPAFGVPSPQIGNPSGPGNDWRVMIPAMTRKLCHDGIGNDIDGALLAYNDSQAYVNWIKYLASSWTLSTPPKWIDGPPWNQYARSSWIGADMFATWHEAACSAASLAWLLRAYGQDLGYLDPAIYLENPPVGISPFVGLTDHRGPTIAAALASRGLSAWDLHLNSSEELAARIDQGPVALDGQKWFGVGHWFVAVGHDAGGIDIRESSGNDIRYLTWSQLYGPVGWSGYAVGVLPHA